MKISRHILSRVISVTMVCSFAASTPILAQAPSAETASGSSGANARLVVNRAANFGILESVNVFVDGVQVGDIGLNQNYDAELRPGPHVVSILTNPKTVGQKPSQRRVDARPGQTYAFTAVWRSPEHASLEQ